MEETASTACRKIPQRMLELTGTPVTIKTANTGKCQDRKKTLRSRILAECGWLKYNLDLGVLDMFSGGPSKMYR